MAKKNLFDPNPSGFIEHDHNNDGLARRGFLKCMAWAGTGALCVMQGGVLKSFALPSQKGSEMALQLPDRLNSSRLVRQPVSETQLPVCR